MVEEIEWACELAEDIEGMTDDVMTVLGLE